ncbi:hypothetical protein MRB53_012424 [Persea americana]|uniref:Uncharacterized protein n=1 Tax=Persea americana TaxID=3435 RepID=A0ACC2LXE4_PERAE|nr:hypothetical protein MRB53_012424 [Persea americana]
MFSSFAGLLCRMDDKGETRMCEEGGRGLSNLLHSRISESFQLIRYQLSDSCISKLCLLLLLRSSLQFLHNLDIYQ